MKKNDSSPRVTEFGTVESLTQYGTGGGSNDTVYLANPAGQNAVLFAQTHGFPNLADAQAAIALQISISVGGQPFGVALANIQGGATHRGSSFNPTVGSTFTP